MKLLTRKWINNSLYSFNKGYFNKVNCIYNAHQPIPFNTFESEFEYQNYISKLYYKNPSNINGWLTPVEIFSPYYAEAFGQWMIDNYEQSNDNLDIYEIGCGNGTFGLDLLNWLQQYNLEIYNSTKYNFIDISNRLSKLQKQRLKKHQHLCQFKNMSFIDWNKIVKKNSFIFAFELLDNLPHDKIILNTKTNTFEQVNYLIKDDGYTIDQL